MNQAWMIGPALIQLSWIYFGIALTISWVVLRWLTVYRHHPNAREEALNALLTGILVTVFSKIIFRFPILLEDPMTVLTYPSGWREALAGLAAAGVILYRAQRKAAIRELIPAAALLFLMTHAVYTVFSQPTGIGIHPAALYMLIASAGAWIIVRQKPNWTGSTIALWGLTMTAAAYVTAPPVYFVMIVPPPFFLSYAAAGLLTAVYLSARVRNAPSYSS
ncbi:hypothetical protein [Alkalicoccus luteus]|uniref:Uncharacterized protein n=1 Tax=Alkalicoccus luteus TaxID=1237094 RepID=A0A969PUX4_9BACI|nr:hypothetical protein [Alkalicoccus luteus]NJP36137.1 hypothetical protein [Alkalicoccus luteus]